MISYRVLLSCKNCESYGFLLNKIVDNCNLAYWINRKMYMHANLQESCNNLQLVVVFKAITCFQTYVYSYMQATYIYSTYIGYAIVHMHSWTFWSVVIFQLHSQLLLVNLNSFHGGWRWNQQLWWRWSKIWKVIKISATFNQFDFNILLFGSEYLFWRICRQQLKGNRMHM